MGATFAVNMAHPRLLWVGGYPPGRDQKIFFNLKESFISFFIEQNIFLTSQLSEKGIIWDLISQCKTFSYIVILMLISHNLHGNVDGTRITVVKLQFLYGPQSFFDGYKNMTDAIHYGNSIKSNTTYHYYFQKFYKKKLYPSIWSIVTDLLQ